MTPRVSVVMPAFNAAPYLAEAMGSVLAQTFSDFELLVIDDGSTDDSAAIATGFTDARIRVIRNDTNTGLAEVRNRGITEARGDYIAWLDSDDVSLPDRLARQVSAMGADTSLALCGTWVRTIPGGREWRYPSDSDVLKARQLFDNPFATSSVMVRRRLLLERNLRFDPSFPPAEDYDLWERLSQGSRITNVPEVLTLYRVHAMQTSRIRVTQQRAAIWAIQARQLAGLSVSPTDSERDLHLDIGVGWAFDQPTGRIREVGQWLEHLGSCNQRLNRFAEPAFHQVLAERWLGVCYGSAARGSSSWSRFWKSGLSGFATVPRSTRVKFIARSVLRAPYHAGR